MTAFATKVYLVIMLTVLGNDIPKFAEEQSKRVDADVATMGSQLPRQLSESSYNVDGTSLTPSSGRYA